MTENKIQHWRSWAGTEFGDENAGAGRLAQIVTDAAGGQRPVWLGRIWPRRTPHWERHSPVALRKVTAAVLEAAEARPGMRIVDLGCAAGTLSLPLAESGAHVLAVDPSPAAVRQLHEEAWQRGLGDLECVAAPIENLRLPPGSVDLVVSSYALHHLRDADKARLVTAVFGWLRPEGRLLIADMMFGRGGSRRDREIIAYKLRRLARRGIGGYWRIAKNAVRYLARFQERPVSMSAWTAMLARSGFSGITANAIAAEAGLVAGTRPGVSGLAFPVSAQRAL
jgi:2-polyprenyl-3-methyl-5-hydroxy-6-metoxy-1,4-benzoquinol methylase